MDTKILRQKILDLAIRGKLVKQDANEEPASVLLARIRKEKERLVKEGKLKKKDLVTTPVSDEDKPFEVPESWEWTNIGEALVNRDSERVPLSTPVRKKQTNRIYDYYGATGIVDKVNGYLFDERLMLIGEDGANLLSRSKNNAFFAEGKYWVNNHAHILDCIDKTVLEYIAMVVNSMSLEDYVTGSAQPKLNQENLNKIPIPLPPLSEQQRIVAEVEKWMSLIDTIENGKENLLQSIATAKSKILDLAVNGKLVEKEGDWEEKTLGEIFQHNTGKALNKSARQEGQLLPYITTSNLYWDHFELDNVKSMYFKDSEIEKCTVTKGDLLVCEGGDIGRSAIWNLDYDICIQNHIHRLRPIIDALPKFYYYVLMFYKSTNNIQGKGIGMLGLSSKQLDKIILPLPPLSEQQRIVTKIEQIFAQLDSIAAAIKS